MPTFRTAKYSHLIVAAALSVMLAWVYYELFLRAAPLVGDMQVHAHLAQTGSFATVPHYLLHWLAKHYAELTGAGMYASMVQVTSIMSLVYFFLFINLFESAKGKVIAVLALLAVPLFNWWDGYAAASGGNTSAVAAYFMPYLGSFPKLQWHNPTMVALLPLLMIWFIAARSFFGQSSRAGLWISSAALTLCTLIKPSFTITIIPAIALLASVDLYARRRVDYLGYAIILLPSLAILTRQFLVHSGSSDLTFVFAPLEVWNHYAEGLGWPLLAAYLFPLATIIAFPRTILSDRLFLLVAFNLLFAIAYSLLFAEVSKTTGHFKHHGNFFWGIQAANQLLFLYMSLRLSSTVAYAWSWRQAIPLAALMLHAVSGIVWIGMIFIATGSR
jgi:hypothetical protein